jgi:hypothetical protein
MIKKACNSRAMEFRSTAIAFLKTLIALFVAFGCVAQTGVVIQRPELCLPHAEFNVGGISYNSAKEDVIKQKGKPPKITVDDKLNLEIYNYGDMAIEIAHGSIVFLSTSSPKYKTPSGLHCGMSKDEAMKIIGLKQYDAKISEYQFVCCSEEIYLVLKFNDRNLLRSIGMGNDLP